MGLATDVRRIIAVSREVQSFQKVARTPGFHRFAFDLVLVANRLRTACLVDQFILLDPVDAFSRLLCCLREDSTSELDFQKVVHIHHSPTGQSFLAHKDLLQERFETLSSESVAAAESLRGWPIFVRPCATPAIFRNANHLKDKLLEILQKISDLSRTIPQSPIELDTSLEADALVPLTAILLEYPVAYVPDRGQGMFLAGVALNVYRCELEHGELGESRVETILKFSCPCELGKIHLDLAPSEVANRLSAKFQKRLVGLEAKVEVKHEVETHDRVML